MAALVSGSFVAGSIASRKEERKDLHQMLDAFFSDDSTQANPTRPGMGPLVATGFVHVPSENVRDLEQAIAAHCAEAGFPDGDEGEFKWSPGRELWMWEHLRGDERRDFFFQVIDTAQDAGAVASVIVEDEDRRAATGLADHRQDATILLLERVEWRLRGTQRTGFVVVDRPGGGRPEENKFLKDCLEAITSGTDYVDYERIAINVVSTPSKLVRCLQLADIVTSCVTAFVSGEAEHSPPVFERIKAILDRDGGRIGGVGLKIHPHLRYMNLYHWFVGDDYLRRGNMGYPLPDEAFPYGRSPDQEQ